MNIRKVAVSRSQVEAEDTPLSALSEPSPTPHFPVKQTRPKSLDKAQKIMEVALDLFSGSHFGSITIKDIARETGFNSALLYYYFESKEDLFRQSVEMAVRRVFEQFEVFHHTMDTPPTILSGWLATHIQQFDLIRKFVKIAVDYAQNGTRIDTIDDAIASFYQNERKLLSSSIARGVSDKIFSTIDPDETATFISTFLDGVVTRSIVFPGFDYKRSIEDLKRILEQHLCCELPAL